MSCVRMYYYPSISKIFTVLNDLLGISQKKPQRCCVDDIIYFPSAKYRHPFSEFIMFQLGEVPVKRKTGKKKDFRDMKSGFDE